MSEKFYTATFIVSGFQFLVALEVLYCFALNSCVTPVLESVVALALFIPFLKLLEARNLPPLGLIARCVHTSTLAVWAIIFASPFWLSWYSHLATIPPYWLRPMLY